LDIIGKYIDFFRTKKVQDIKIKEIIDDLLINHTEAIKANENGGWCAISNLTFYYDTK